MPRRPGHPEDADPVPRYEAVAPASAFPTPSTGPAFVHDEPPPPLYEQIIYANPGGQAPGGYPATTTAFLPWQTVPFYLTSIDRADKEEPTTALYFRLPTDAQADQGHSVANACRCSERYDCECNLRGPAMFTAEHSGNEILVMRCTNRNDIVARISRGSLVHRKRWTMTDGRGANTASVERDGNRTRIRLQDGTPPLVWERGAGGSYSLLVDGPERISIAQHTPNGVFSIDDRTERMPQNLACDIEGCPFISSIHGFAFRCLTCSDRLKDDTVDYCEAHIEDACRKHDPKHTFVRLPCRTGAAGEPDDRVRETVLLRMNDLLSARWQHEVTVATLAVALLDS